MFFVICGGLDGDSGRQGGVHGRHRNVQRILQRVPQTLWPSGVRASRERPVDPRLQDNGKVGVGTRRIQIKLVVGLVNVVPLPAHVERQQGKPHLLRPHHTKWMVWNENATLTSLANGVDLAVDEQEATLFDNHGFYLYAHIFIRCAPFVSHTILEAPLDCRKRGVLAAFLEAS